MAYSYTAVQRDDVTARADASRRERRLNWERVDQQKLAERASIMVREAHDTKPATCRLDDDCR